MKPSIFSLKKIQQLHAGNRFYQANCYLVKLENGALGVLKDFLHNKTSLIRPVAGFFARREKQAYVRIGGMAGIPSFWGAPSDYSILLEYIDAPTLRQIKEPPPQCYFDALEELIKDMHRRGVAHGEIRMSNCLITADQAPYLIDLTTASAADPSRPGRLFRLKQEIDWYCFLKIKKRMLGSLSSQENHKLARLKRLGSCVQPHVEF
jgi:RIO-like serine/threonine protein kinase